MGANSILGLQKGGGTNRPLNTTGKFTVGWDIIIAEESFNVIGANFDEIELLETGFYIVAFTHGYTNLGTTRQQARAFIERDNNTSGLAWLKDDGLVGRNYNRGADGATEGVSHSVGLVRVDIAGERIRLCFQHEGSVFNANENDLLCSLQAFKLPDTVPLMTVSLGSDQTIPLTTERVLDFDTLVHSNQASGVFTHNSGTGEITVEQAGFYLFLFQGNIFVNDAATRSETHTWLEYGGAQIERTETHAYTRSANNTKRASFHLAHVNEVLSGQEGSNARMKGLFFRADRTLPLNSFLAGETRMSVIRLVDDGTNSAFARLRSTVNNDARTADLTYFPWNDQIQLETGTEGYQHNVAVNNDAITANRARKRMVLYHIAIDRNADTTDTNARRLLHQFNLSLDEGSIDYQLGPTTAFNRGRQGAFPFDNSSSSHLAIFGEFTTPSFIWGDGQTMSLRAQRISTDSPGVAVDYSANECEIAVLHLAKVFPDGISNNITADGQAEGASTARATVSLAQETRGRSLGAADARAPPALAQEARAQVDAAADVPRGTGVLDLRLVGQIDAEALARTGDATITSVAVAAGQSDSIGLARATAAVTSDARGRGQAYSLEQATATRDAGLAGQAAGESYTRSDFAFPKDARGRALGGSQARATAIEIVLVEARGHTQAYDLVQAPANVAVEARGRAQAGTTATADITIVGGLEAAGAALSGVLARVPATVAAEARGRARALNEAQAPAEITSEARGRTTGGVTKRATAAVALDLRGRAQAGGSSVVAGAFELRSFSRTSESRADIRAPANLALDARGAALAQTDLVAPAGLAQEARGRAQARGAVLRAIAADVGVEQAAGRAQGRTAIRAFAVVAVEARGSTVAARSIARSESNLALDGRARTVSRPSAQTLASLSLAAQGRGQARGTSSVQADFEFVSVGRSTGSRTELRALAVVSQDTRGRSIGAPQVKAPAGFQIPAAGSTIAGVEIRAAIVGGQAKTAAGRALGQGLFQKFLVRGSLETRIRAIASRGELRTGSVGQTQTALARTLGTATSIKATISQEVLGLYQITTRAARTKLEALATSNSWTIDYDNSRAMSSGSGLRFRASMVFEDVDVTADEQGGRLTTIARGSLFVWIFYPMESGSQPPILAAKTITRDFTEVRVGNVDWLTPRIIRRGLPRTWQTQADPCYEVELECPFWAEDVIDRPTHQNVTVDGLYDDIAQEVRRYFIAQVETGGGYVTQYDGLPFTKPDTEHARFAMVDGFAQFADHNGAGGIHRRAGIMEAEIALPLETNDGVGLAFADLIDKRFRGIDIGGIRFGQPLLNPGRRVGDEWRMRVTTPWEVDELVTT